MDNLLEKLLKLAGETAIIYKKDTFSVKGKLKYLGNDLWQVKEDVNNYLSFRQVQIINIIDDKSSKYIEVR